MVVRFGVATIFATVRNRFTKNEAAAFLEQASGCSIGDSALGIIYETTEGWAVGLHLTAVSLRHGVDIYKFIRGFGGDSGQIRDYLLSEALSHQPPTARDWLCKTAILERFCASLCEAVCALDDDEERDSLDGQGFVRLLEASGLPCVALDQRAEWYRYHHLVQELLQRQLEDRFMPEEISGLHRRAAAWFEGQGSLEEAIHHTLQADEPAAASRLMVRHRNEILNEEQWYRLGHWLRRLPAELVENDPELMILKSWQLRSQGRHEEILPVLASIEKCLSSEPQGSGANQRLLGAVEALRGYQYYAESRIDLALKCAEQALMRLPPDCLSERGFALMTMGGTLRASGDLEGARKVIYNALADTSLPTGTFQGRMLTTLCIINWVAADLAALRLVAEQCLKLSEKLGLVESGMNARYFLGSVQYHKLGVHGRREAVAKARALGILKKN